MPRHTRTPRTLENKHAALVVELAKEIREPGDAIEPIIIEDITPITNTLRVQVIWSKWGDIPFEIRTATILDAYRQAYGPDHGHEITLALGYDYWEAKNVGLLPISIHPRLDAGDSLTKEQYFAAMREFGSPVEYSEHGPQLWFATLGDAETAKDQLEKNLTGSKWTIVVDREYMEEPHFVDN